MLFYKRLRRRDTNIWILLNHNVSDVEGHSLAIPTSGVSTPIRIYAEDALP